MKPTDLINNTIGDKDFIDRYYKLDNKDLIIRQLGMLDLFTDMYIEFFGMYETIKLFRNNGFSDEELLGMNFDQEDLDDTEEEE